MDFPGVPVFEDATVDPQILIVEKTKYLGETNACAIKERTEEISSAVEQGQINITFNDEPWTIRDNRVSAALKRIESCGTSLKDMPIEINYGIKTGYNDAYFIDDAVKNSLIEEDSSSKEMIRPLFRGRDISPWKSIIIH